MSKLSQSIPAGRLQSHTELHAVKYNDTRWSFKLRIITIYKKREFVPLLGLHYVDDLRLNII